MRVSLGGAEVDLVDRDEVLDAVDAKLASSQGAPLYLASANMDHLYHFGLDSGREGAFEAGRGGADWLVLLDGMPLVWAARRMTGVRWEQLAGSELLPDLLSAASRARASVGFLGGSTATHRALEAALAEQFPFLRLAGTWSPERSELEDPVASGRIADEIRAAGVDLLVVGLGKPRQEEWMSRYGGRTGARVAAAFGAAADFLAGTAVRAPARWSSAGLEWCYRLVAEPRRLARRYLVQGPSSAYRLWTQSPSEPVTDRAPMMSTPASWRTRLGRLLVGGDAAIIAGSSFLAYQLRGFLGELGVVQGFESEVAAAVALLPLWLMILAVLGCYRHEYLNAGTEALKRFFGGAVTGLFALGFISFAFNLQLSRGYVLALFASVLMLGTGSRLAVRHYLSEQRRRGRFIQNVLVVGADEEGIEVAEAMSRHTPAGYRVVGFLDDTLEEGTAVLGDLEVVGRTWQVLDRAYDLRAGLVLVSPSGLAPGTLREVTLQLEGSPVDLAVAPSLFSVVTRRVAVESVDNVPVLHVDQIRLERGKAIAKRALDVAGSAALLLFALPLMVLSALAVACGSGKPILFRQTRVGKDGAEFSVLKFRTMVPDAEERLEEIAAHNEAGDGFFKMADDPRVTRVGRHLRRWSLDELPQLFNVLRGEMSLVGPRPPLPREVEKYDPLHMRRLRVRPGITGTWQVSGRSDVPFDEAVRMEVFYIENWSLATDLMILARTVSAVLRTRGAY
jgi:exopolysaccharide biosynthesis polyprenyl glycosylphosphotransferase